MLALPSISILLLIGCLLGVSCVELDYIPFSKSQSPFILIRHGAPGKGPSQVLPVLSAEALMDHLKQHALDKLECSGTLFIYDLPQLSREWFYGPTEGDALASLVRVEAAGSSEAFLCRAVTDPARLQSLLNKTLTSICANPSTLHLHSANGLLAVRDVLFPKAGRSTPLLMVTIQMEDEKEAAKIFQDVRRILSDSSPTTLYYSLLINTRPVQASGPSQLRVPNPLRVLGLHDQFSAAAAAASNTTQDAETAFLLDQTSFTNHAMYTCGMVALLLVVFVGMAIYLVVNIHVPSRLGRKDQ